MAANRVAHTVTSPYKQVFAFGKARPAGSAVQTAVVVWQSETSFNPHTIRMATKKGQAKVTIYPDWCKGCGICAAFCPAKVMELGTDGKAHVLREEDCVNCGFCELHCPDFAISVTPKETSRRHTDEDVDPGSARGAMAGVSDPGPEEHIRVSVVDAQTDGANGEGSDEKA